MDHTDKSSENERNDHDHNNDHGKDEVTIYIGGKPKEIKRGRHTVAEIKTLGGIPLADDLEQKVDGKLVLLADNSSVTIKGEEQFFGHPKDSGSSAR